MRYTKATVVERALRVLDDYGLADLSMRRLGTELGVQPGALYHHFASKQLLLAALADEVLAHGRTPREDGRWDELVSDRCEVLRDAMLAYRDGAELVATVHAFGLGERDPAQPLADALAAAGFGDDLVETATSTLLHFVLGYALDEQTNLQADSAGALAGSHHRRSDFGLGVRLVIEGIRAHATTGRMGT